MNIKMTKDEFLIVLSLNLIFYFLFFQIAKFYKLVNNLGNWLIFQIKNFEIGNFLVGYKISNNQM